MPTLVLLPGDGIGPEVIAEVRRVAKALTPDLTLEERPFGGVSYDRLGTPLTDDTLALARSSDAVLMGAVGMVPSALGWGGLPLVRDLARRWQGTQGGEIRFMTSRVKARGAGVLPFPEMEMSGMGH
mgnify:CR=1 FL=1